MWQNKLHTSELETKEKEEGLGSHYPFDGTPQWLQTSHLPLKAISFKAISFKATDWGPNL
jgi:hypothetical protein